MEPRGFSREQQMLGVAVAMIVFIVSLLLDWVGIDTPVGDVATQGTDPNSWWVALALAVIGGAIFAADALDYPLPVRWASLGVGALATVLVCAWAVFHAIDGTEGPAGLKMGAWIGIIASAAGTVLAARVWTRERS